MKVHGWGTCIAVLGCLKMARSYVCMWPVCGVGQCIICNINAKFVYVHPRCTSMNILCSAVLDDMPVCTLHSAMQGKGDSHSEHAVAMPEIVWPMWTSTVFSAINAFMERLNDLHEVVSTYIHFR